MISVADISRIEHRRIKMKKQLYKTILEQFSKKIKLSVEHGHSQIFLSVPEFVFGYPTFDRDAATIYLMRQLRLLGYNVIRYGQYDIYITWVREPESTMEQDMDILPSLVNLRKAADNIRGKNAHKK